MGERLRDGWDTSAEWAAETSDVMRDILDDVEGHCEGGGATVLCVVRHVSSDDEVADEAERPCGAQRACCEERQSRSASDGETPLMDAFDIHNPAQLGRLGEELAARYMESSGYAVQERNYRTPHGEADIICRNGDETVLIEVKTRLGAHARPEEAVTHEKIRRYRNITLDYLARPESTPYVRFDVIALNVVGAHAARVHHFVGVCSWEG